MLYGCGTDALRMRYRRGTDAVRMRYRCGTRCCAPSSSRGRAAAPPASPCGRCLRSSRPERWRPNGGGAGHGAAAGGCGGPGRVRGVPAVSGETGRAAAADGRGAARRLGRGPVAFSCGGGSGSPRNVSPAEIPAARAPRCTSSSRLFGVRGGFVVSHTAHPRAVHCRD